MNKSEYRYREEPSQGKKSTSASPLNSIMGGGEGAQVMVAEINKMLPAIKKFSRENWKLVAMVSGGIAVLAFGAYIYFNQEQGESNVQT